MSDQSPLEKAKYGFLKLIDLSGFKVFDPVVRLFFGEEPKKQIGEIGRYMIMPIIFVCICLLTWNFIAPRHKTKSGEVPTPKQVWNALVINDTLSDREKEKESDFQITDKERLNRLESVEKLIKKKTVESEKLKQNLAEVEKSIATEKKERSAPLRLQKDTLTTQNKQAAAARKKEAESLAESIAKKEATPNQLLDFLRNAATLTEQEKDAVKEIKEDIALVIDAKPKRLEEARAASNAIANEVQHLLKRRDYLSGDNRSQKVSAAESKVVAAREKLDNADSAKAILSAAKSVIKLEERPTKIAEQSYAAASTIWFQMWRSLFTVFVGFLLAAAIAIPVGTLCGMNRIAMACLTPIISVFKPVSPVVWLFIFQIIIGAFFPNPETHPLFLFVNSLPIIGSLNTNPALIFSACTVAMCAVWPALVNTALGVSSVEQDHLNVAKVLRLGLWSRLTKIVIPSALPLVFAGLRISLGVGWMVLIAAEALSSSEGLGKYVWDQYQNGSVQTLSNILFACFLIGIIGFFLDRMMIIMQRTVSFDDGAATV